AQHLSTLHGAIRTLASTGRSADIEKLDRLIRCFKPVGCAGQNPERSLSKEETELLQDIDFTALAKEFQLYDPEHFKLFGDEDDTGRRQRKAYAATLHSLSHVQRIGTAWIRQQGERTTINAAENLLDTERGGVILDATAPIDQTYLVAPQKFRI